MKKVNKKKGFTLAELLVVIAIIAILVAIAVPIFTGALDSANDAVKQANYRSAKSAAQADYLTSTVSTVKTAREAGTALTYSYSVDDTTKNIEIKLVAAGDENVGADAATDNTTGFVTIGG